MEQIGMEILDGVKYIAANTDALKLLRIAWIIAVCGYGWKVFCGAIKAVISVVRYAKGGSCIEYDDEDDEEDDF